ncbi:MAG: hypothetical protein ACLP5H_11220 [Desulfomonilaceae bacterium]
MRAEQFSQIQAETEFGHVRRTFFPRWDRKCLWTVKVMADLDDCVGLCCKKSRTIQLLPDLGDYTLRYALIHEIAHDSVKTGVIFDCHGYGWQQRMEAAARRAERLGMSELAIEIRQDIGRYTSLEEKERRVQALTNAPLI